ncbi:NAD(P)-binding domain-containing protein [Flavobacterium sp. H122]|uniref:NAD(P)-binding domain-containing protein n=1 Tax=Flavobacterium sp. H122 TaxID=2529860 RepID=UPI0010AB280A|nr:NAD(P)-binding domain-containing protein [Flavobacterium sp. H122]
MQKISILGCGWLGFPLAQKLVKSGFNVKGSTTSEEKLSQLKEAGINPFLIAVTENKIEGNMSEFLKDSDILIINIPPKLRSSNIENFVDKIKNLIPFIEQSTIEKVLFVSSTSVYGDLPLENNQKAVVFSEESNPKPDTEGGRQLLETENLLLNNNHFSTTVLRFGGLIGAERQPVKHLAGRQNLENSDAPVNLIHQTDCIAVIEKIILNNSFGEVFNAVAPFHPSRKEYYISKAKMLGLTAPHFNENTISEGKIISAEKITNLLKYNFNTEKY